MSPRAISELVQAWARARATRQPVGQREAAGMFIAQYGAREALRITRQVNAGAKEGFWRGVLTHLERAAE